MSDMKCPYCGEKLQQTYSFNPTQFWCSNYYDPKHPINLQGTKELWQALIDTKNQLTVEHTTHDILQEELKKLQTELERTRKALDVAVEGIKYMRNNCLEYAADYMDKADEILEQITALEQKD